MTRYKRKTQKGDGTNTGVTRTKGYNSKRFTPGFQRFSLSSAYQSSKAVGTAIKNSRAEKARKKKAKTRRASLATKLKPSLSVSLVGIPGSGKTTFFKQISSIYSPKDFELLLENEGRSQAQATLLKTTLSILDLVEEALIAKKAKEASETLMNNFPQYLFTEAVADAIICLWKDTQFLTMYRKSKYFQGNELVAYAKGCKKLLNDGYSIPKDLHLKLHNETHGYNSSSVSLEAARVKLLDVGGLYERRTEWEYFLRQSNVVLFFSSLSEYVYYTEDEEKENFLHDSNQMFSVLCESDFLVDKSVKIIFTKSDVLRALLHTWKFGIHKSNPTLFSDAPQSLSFHDNYQYICETFLKQCDNENSFLKRENVSCVIVDNFNEKNIRDVFEDIISSSATKTRINGRIKEDFDRYVRRSSVSSNANRLQNFAATSTGFVEVEQDVDEDLLDTTYKGLAEIEDEAKKHDSSTASETTFHKSSGSKSINTSRSQPSGESLRQSLGARFRNSFLSKKQKNILEF
eukprot:snap_masked-scaffold_15-processed-gene-4.51-mRNA-1 protein AED:1.00 eAED:1.00 QI:0/-1/0/0/-1/1/1/0/516